jgi:hypothetical protein
VISRQKEIAQKIGNETDLQNGKMLLAVMFMLTVLSPLRMMIRASLSLAVV